MAVGRNESCPCGSGRKYKKCCLGAEGGKVHPAHRMDELLVQEMFAWARRAMPADALQRVVDAEDHLVPLLAQLTLYNRPVGGRSIARAFLAERGRYLDQAGRAWIQAQQATALSLWRVDGVRPDEGLELVDVFTGERRFVHDVGASRSAELTRTLLGRVLDWEGDTLLVGCHPQPLPLFDAMHVEQDLRHSLGLEGTVHPAQLRDTFAVWKMVEVWEEAAHRLPFREVPFHNTDDEPIELNIDTYSLRDRTEAVRRLAAAPPDDHLVDTPSEAVVLVQRRGTTMAHLFVEAQRLKLATNSRARRDRYRAWLDAVLDDGATHDSHEVVDYRQARAQASATGA